MLEARFPGARVASRLPVETLSLSDLVQRCGIQPGPNNWLVADAPGLESILLSALRDADLTRCFPHLVLRSGSGVGRVSDSGSPMDAFIECGYRGLGNGDIGDRDGTNVHYMFVDRFPLRRDLEEKIQVLERRLVALTSENEDLLEQLSEARLASDARRSEIRLWDEKVQQLERSHEACVADLKKQISSLRQERDRRLESMDDTLDRTKANLSLSLRLQALRENELKELRGRYDSLLETRDTQHDLLRQIRERLNLAAEYLLELKNEHDEGRRVELTSSLLQALAHDRANRD